MEYENILVFGNMRSDVFYKTPEWRNLRYRTLKYYGNRCQACGSGPQNGAVLQVDHIKPRSLFPNLCLEFSNLQVLCEVCHSAKRDEFIDDFRKGFLIEGPDNIQEFFLVKPYHLKLMTQYPRTHDEVSLYSSGVLCARKKLRSRWRSMVAFMRVARMTYPEVVSMTLEDLAETKHFNSGFVRKFRHGKKPNERLFELDGCCFPDDLSLLVAKC